MSGHDEHGFGHVMPIKGLITVFLALVALTVLTVVVAQFDTGRYDIVVAMAIATVKALIVAGFFMHLLHDKVLNIVAFFGSVAFVALFLAFAVLDTQEYNDSLERNQAITAPK
jgi:cytochrome c oxidase subunit IV